MTLIAGWTAEKRFSRDAPFEHIHPHSDGYMVRRYAIGAVCTPVSDGGRIVLRAEEQVEKADRIGALIELAQQAPRSLSYATVRPSTPWLASC